MFWIIITLFLFILIFGTMLVAGFSAAPWLPTFKKDVKAGIALANIKDGDVVYDLGSGDGRWLFLTAQETLAGKVIGYEISFLLYIFSVIKRCFSKDKKRIKIKYQSLYKADFPKADVIYCFGLIKVMKKLEPVLEKKMKPGSRLVSYVFKLPNKEPAEIFKANNKSLPIYLYKY